MDFILSRDNESVISNCFDLYSHASKDEWNQKLSYLRKGMGIPKLESIRL